LRHAEAYAAKSTREHRQNSLPPGAREQVEKLRASATLRVPRLHLGTPLQTLRVLFSLLLFTRHAPLLTHHLFVFSSLATSH